MSHWRDVPTSPQAAAIDLVMKGFAAQVLRLAPHGTIQACIDRGWLKVYHKGNGLRLTWTNGGMAALERYRIKFGRIR